MRNNRVYLKTIGLVLIILATVLFPMLEVWADIPEYTTEEILQLIEANGGPDGLDLSGVNLSGIDLGRERIQTELAKVQGRDPKAEPTWWANLELLYPYPEPHARTLGINLRKVNLREAILWEANLRGACLWDANLQGAWLNDAKLQEAGLSGANLRGAQLWATNLQGADLWLADLQRAWLTGANLQDANMMNVDLQGALLEGADLQGAHLEAADLTDVNLLYAHNLDGIYLSGAKLSNTNLSAQQLGGSLGEEREIDDYRTNEINLALMKAKETYRALKVNFSQMGRYDDAMWAYRKEREMERKAHWADRSLAKWLFSWIIDALTGYGQEPLRVVGWSGVIIAVFAVMYWLFGGLGTAGQEEVAGSGILYALRPLPHHAFRRNVRVFRRVRHRRGGRRKRQEMPPRSRDPRDWLRTLVYSIATFATMTYGGLEPRTLRTQMFTSIEAVFGIIMLALLMFVIGNRIGGI
jgi:uncharacterized protein YjbI with pentapeptide repeats